MPVRQQPFTLQGLINLAISFLKKYKQLINFKNEKKNK
jgi:hypothetical protein